MPTVFVCCTIYLYCIFERTKIYLFSNVSCNRDHIYHDYLLIGTGFGCNSIECGDRSLANSFRSCFSLNCHFLGRTICNIWTQGWVKRKTGIARKRHLSRPTSSFAYLARVDRVFGYLCRPIRSDRIETQHCFSRRERKVTRQRSQCLEALMHRHVACHRSTLSFIRKQARGKLYSRIQSVIITSVPTRFNCNR